MSARLCLPFLTCLALSALLPAPAGATFPGANGLIAYRSGSAIVTVDPATKSSALLHSGSGILSPSYSPDGTKIAYVEGGNIWIMDANGANRRLVYDGPNPINTVAFHSDGSSVVFSRYVNNAQFPQAAANIQRIGLNGTGLTDVSTLTDKVEDYAADVSLSGTIAWTRDPRDPGGNRGDLLQNGAVIGSTATLDTEAAPSYSPDGTKIAFYRKNEYETGFSNIYVVPAVGGAVTPLTTDNTASYPVWSPDGTKIAYVRKGEGTVQKAVFVMNADGSDPVRVGPFGDPNQTLELSWQRVPGDNSPPPPTQTPPPASSPPPGNTPAPPVMACGGLDRADGLPVSVSLSAAAAFSRTLAPRLRVVAPDAATAMDVSNDRSFGSAINLPLASSTVDVPWNLAASGGDEVPRTVFVRFRGPCVDQTRTFEDSILLDRKRPVVSSVAQSGTKVRIKAADKGSGLARMQVTTNKRKPGAWRPFKRTVVRKDANRVSVRVRDKAGNISAWRAAPRRPR